MNYYELFVHLFHIIFVGGLFLYVGIKRNDISSFFFPLLLVLGVVIILYHSYKVYSYLQKHKSYWVNLIHIFIVGPLLIYIGYHKDKTIRLYYDGYYLAKSIQN